MCRHMFDGQTFVTAQHHPLYTYQGEGGFLTRLCNAVTFRYKADIMLKF